MNQLETIALEVEREITGESGGVAVRNYAKTFAKILVERLTRDAEPFNNQPGKEHAMQDDLMKFDPTNRTPHPYPSHAEQYRKWHGLTAWIYNPWTGKPRDPRDIGSDVQGLLIAPPAEYDEYDTCPGCGPGLPCVCAKTLPDK